MRLLLNDHPRGFAESLAEREERPLGGPDHFEAQIAEHVGSHLLGPQGQEVAIPLSGAVLPEQGRPARHHPTLGRLTLQKPRM